MWILGAYLRLSKEDKHKKDESNSIANQRELILDYIENDMEDEEVSVYEFYKDDGISGTTKEERVDFKRMLDDIETKGINCVIVKDLSRFARNYAESSQLVSQYFVEKSIRFISILDGIDTYKEPESINRLDVTLKQLMNENFCEETSRKIRGTFKVKRRQGIFIGSTSPYGYLKSSEEKGKLIIDPEASEIVKLIFSWFLEGMSRQKITQKLNDLQIPCPTEYKRLHGIKYGNPHDKYFSSYLWSAKTVTDILSNQVYIGTMVQGRDKILSYKVHKQIRQPKDKWYVVPDTHEAIIDKMNFERVQKLLTWDIKEMKSQKTTALFSGLLSCYDCKKAMNKQVKGDKTYYYCRTYKEKSKSACTRHSIREDRLSMAVLHSINAQLSMIFEMEKIIQSIENPQNYENEYRNLLSLVEVKEKKLKDISKIRAQAYSDWKEQLLTRDDYLAIKSMQDEKMERLKQELIRIRENLTKMEDRKKLTSEYFQFFKKYQCVDKLDRGLLVALIDKIYIKEGGEIIICFRYQDQFQLIMNMFQEELEPKQNKLTLH